MADFERMLAQTMDEARDRYRDVFLENIAFSTTTKLDGTVVYSAVVLLQAARDE